MFGLRRISIGKTVALALALLVVFVAVHIYRWGRPAPLAFHAAGHNQWRAPEGSLIGTRDADGDGTWDTLLTGDQDRELHPAAPESRLLIVCLDGVPYSELRAVWDAGRFREFYAPVQLVSTFPSDTEPAMTAILQASSAEGYENRFFYRKRGKIVGGMAVTLAQSAPYLKKLNYDEPAPLKGLQYFAPVKAYRADLGRLRQRFLASPAPVYLAHISSSDGLYHVMPPEQIRPLLEEADDLLRDLFLAAGGKLRMVLFSDHGNDLTPAQPAPLRESLEHGGYRWATSLGGPRDVALPQYGLVSFAAVYTQPAAVNGVAEVLAKTEGVEAVAYQAGGLLQVRTRDAIASIEFDRDLTRFRYLPERGDPLELLPALEELRRQGKVDASGFVAEQDLFTATLPLRYPDALYRVAEWALEARSPIANRSDIMVSLRPGFYSGSGFFKSLVTLRSTHGGLNRGSTLGFAMTTDRRLPAAQRYDQLLAPYLK